MASKVLCTFGVVLVCLHTFVVVRTSPMGRKTSSSLQRSLKRNLTILSRVFNLTQNSSNDYTVKGHFYRDSAAVVPPKSGPIDLSLVRARPTNVRVMRLFSRYGFFVQMSKDGFVNGTIDDLDSGLFEFQSVHAGVIRIKNVASGRYLAMDKHGRLRGRIRLSLETLFLEFQFKDGYHRYRSYKYKNMYIGIRRNGTRKPGRHTGPNQKAIQFLPLPPGE